MHVAPSDFVLHSLSLIYTIYIILYRIIRNIQHYTMRQEFWPRMHVAPSDFMALTRGGELCDERGQLGLAEFEQAMRKLELMIEREEKKDRNPELAGGTDGSADV